jgi:hypothetical protein
MAGFGLNLKSVEYLQSQCLTRWHNIFPPQKLKKINRWFRGRPSVPEPTIRRSPDLLY